MEAQTLNKPETPAAPFAIGAPVSFPGGGEGYVVAVARSTARTFTLGGTLSGGAMRRDQWEITLASASGVSTVSENIAAPMVARAAGRAPLTPEEAAVWHAQALEA